jgi:hypothetical protein
MEKFRQREQNSRTIARSGAPRCLNEHVVSLLATNGQSPGKYLHMDEAPSDETDFLAFDALVAEQETRFTDLVFDPALDASCLPPLFSRLDEGMIEMVNPGRISLSGSQATAMFEKLLNLGLKTLSIFLKEDYCQAVNCAFQHFLRESSVPRLILVCRRGDWIFPQALQFICMGILNSSVKLLCLRRNKV